MLEGWYCRTLANEQNDADRNMQKELKVDGSGDDSGSDDTSNRNDSRQTLNSTTDYKSQYRYLKRKLKFLIYENEFFQDALRVNQRRLLKVSRDRAFLLDRLLQYERPENTSSESEETETSEDESTKDEQKQKADYSLGNTSPSAGCRKRRSRAHSQLHIRTSPKTLSVNSILTESAHVMNTRMSAETPNHLQPRTCILQPLSVRVQEAAPTMFSNCPSRDSDSNDGMINGSSPAHLATEECVSMEFNN